MGTQGMKEVEGDLHQRELIRISLSQAITLLLTFHLTFSRTNLPSTGGHRQRETEEVLDLGRCCDALLVLAHISLPAHDNVQHETVK